MLVAAFAILAFAPPQEWALLPYYDEPLMSRSIVAVLVRPDLPTAEAPGRVIMISVRNPRMRRFSGANEYWTENWVECPSADRPGAAGLLRRGDFPGEPLPSDGLDSVPPRPARADNLVPRGDFSNALIDICSGGMARFERLSGRPEQVLATLNSRQERQIAEARAAMRTRDIERVDTWTLAVRRPDVTMAIREAGPFMAPGFDHSLEMLRTSRAVDGSVQQAVEVYSVDCSDGRIQRDFSGPAVAEHPLHRVEPSEMNVRLPLREHRTMGVDAAEDIAATAFCGNTLENAVRFEGNWATIVNRLRVDIDAPS